MQPQQRFFLILPVEELIMVTVIRELGRLNDQPLTLRRQPPWGRPRPWKPSEVAVCHLWVRQGSVRMHNEWELHTLVSQWFSHSRFPQLPCAVAAGLRAWPSSAEVGITARLATASGRHCLWGLRLCFRCPQIPHRVAKLNAVDVHADLSCGVKSAELPSTQREGVSSS
ncbi:hypothetical protein BJV77DRAFT_644268 [Russula vinacea]|nr:hypothetical protein BJV77DRAFT_644268 [Russula vinacea]